MRAAVSLLLVATVVVLVWKIGPRVRDGLERRQEKHGGALQELPERSPTEVKSPRIVARPSGAVHDPGGYRFHVDVRGWAARRYGEQPRATRFDRAADATLARLSRDDVRYDSALARAADALATVITTTDVPITGALSDFVLLRAGVATPGVRRFLYYTSRTNDDAFLGHLGEVIGREPRSRAGLRVGVGSASGAREARFRHTYVILVVDPAVALSPIPRTAGHGDTIVVSGRLASGLGQPEVLALEPAGTVQELSVTQKRDGGFRAEARLDRSGDVWFEVLAQGRAGPEVAALFSVSVDSPASDRFEGLAPPEEGAMGSPDELEKLAFELLNADRDRLGLPALAWSPALARIARGHARDMRDNGFVAHVSPRTGSVSDRAAAVGFAHLELGENVARDDSVYSAEEALMRSLGHRENILNPRFTELGVGVAIEERLGGGRALSIVQNFALPARRLDPEEAAAQIRAQVTHARDHLGRPPLRRLKRLRDVARAAVAGSVESRRGDPRDLAATAQRLLEADRPNVGSIAIRAYTLPSLEDFDVPEVATKSSAATIGVAVAQGDDLAEDPRIWLVLLVGDEAR